MIKGSRGYMASARDFRNNCVKHKRCGGTRKCVILHFRISNSGVNSVIEKGEDHQLQKIVRIPLQADELGLGCLRLKVRLIHCMECGQYHKAPINCILGEFVPGNSKSSPRRDPGFPVGAGENLTFPTLAS